MQALEARFVSSQYEDPIGALFKLTQHGSINNYLSKFETLANHIKRLPPSFMLSCFIFGYAQEICYEVQALQPLTLIQAAALARLQEEKFCDSQQTFHSKPNFNVSSEPQTPTCFDLCS